MTYFPLPEDALQPFTTRNGSVFVTNSMLDRFLNETVDLEMEASERLRWLAINVESQTFDDGWFSLKRIYDRAIEENSNNIDSYHSLVISAIEWINPRQTEPIQDRIEIAKEAEAYLLQAKLLAPTDADLIYSHGKLLYSHPERVSHKDSEYVGLALEQFEVALAQDSKHQMAALYKAHCLNDQEQWRNAFEAYSKVDTKELIKQYPYWKWRTLKLQEQKALCCAKMGDINQAIQILLNFFDTVEQLSEQASKYDVVNLDESVDLLTNIITNRPELLQRLKTIAERAGWEDYYQWNAAPNTSTSQAVDP
ncbi:MAG: hypothetical protein AAF978_08825 [Cyanobacteria bacterium P01_E01_bin.48]